MRCMLSGLSRLLKQTKSALKAPSFIAIGHVTWIETLTMATLIIKFYSYYCPRLSYQRRHHHWLVLGIGRFKVKQQAFRLDVIIGRPAVLAGRYLSSKPKYFLAPANESSTSSNSTKTPIYLLSSCCVDY